MLRGWWARCTATRLRRVALAGALGVIAIAVAAHVVRDHAAGQHWHYFPDSSIFLETARQSPSFEHLFYPKPVFVPLLYRLVGDDFARIAAFQLGFAFVAWTLLAGVLVIAASRHRTRVAAVIVWLAFLLAPLRVGWSGVLLGESVNDSVMAIVLAVATALTLVTRIAHGRRRTIAASALAAALVVATFAWQLTRDTNPIITIVATLIAAWIWRVDRCIRRDRWALALVAAVLLGAGVSMWSASTAPSPSAPRIPYCLHWSEVRARSAYPMINNICERTLKDEDGRELLLETGMPGVDDRLAHPVGDELFSDARYAPLRAWVAAHGRGVYLRWLIRHPIQRADELCLHIWDALSPRLDAYMPPGWIANPGGIGALFTLLTRSKAVLLVLLALAPIFLRRPRATPLAGIAMVTLVSGIIGVAASYYGDAIEIPRHCYGAGQQVVLGLFLAVIARLDQRQAPTENAV